MHKVFPLVYFLVQQMQVVSFRRKQDDLDQNSQGSKHRANSAAVFGKLGMRISCQLKLKYEFNSINLEHLGLTEIQGILSQA